MPYRSVLARFRVRPAFGGENDLVALVVRKGGDFAGMGMKMSRTDAL